MDLAVKKFLNLCGENSGLFVVLAGVISYTQLGYNVKSSTLYLESTAENVCMGKVCGRYIWLKLANLAIFIPFLVLRISLSKYSL